MTDLISSGEPDPAERPTVATSFSEGQPDSDSLWLHAFKDVLEREDIGEETDFFDAGGYSLLVPQLMARYEELAGWRPAMSLIFDVSSPAALESATLARQDQEVDGG